MNSGESKAGSELVSVVMPVRDAGSWLHEAVASILSQTHRRLELLVVDDHSADRAVSSLPRDDPRLRLMASGPGESGVVAAFNLGWRRARGAYIARMDADDLALPDRLARQVALLQARPDVAVCGACVELFSDGPLAAGNQHYQAWLNGLREPRDIRREMFIESPIPNPTAMFRRAVLEQLGGYRETRWPEDYDLFLRADAAGLKMAKPDGVLLRWRDHEQRLTHTDQRYTRLAFQQAKAHYLVHGRGLTRHLLLWGAGPGGRLLHDLLVAEGAQVEGFVDVHPRRVGGLKRGLPVWPVEQAAAWRQGTVLVAVGARGARSRIRRYLDQHGHREGESYLFAL